MYGNLSLFFWWQIVAAPWRCGGHKRTCHQVNTQHSVSKNMPSPAYHWCSHSAVMPVMMPPPLLLALTLAISVSLSLHQQTSHVQHILRVGRPELVHSGQCSHPLQLDAWGCFQCHWGLRPCYLFLPLPARQQLTEIWHLTGAQLLHWQLGKLAHHIHRLPGGWQEASWAFISRARWIIYFLHTRF